MIAVFFKAERIVERRDGGDGIEAITFSRCRKLLAFGGADATDMGDEFNLTFRLFSDDFQYLFALGKALYKGFAGRTTHVQTVDALLNIELNQAAQTRFIQCLLLIKRSQECSHYAT